MLSLFRRGRVHGRLVAALIVTLAPSLNAQSVLDRPPNLLGTWVGPAGTLHFNFLHRFRSSDTPDNKVSSSPTFLVAVGAPWQSLIGFQYATNSQIVARYPNEWEFFARVAPLAQQRGAPLDLSVHAAYNLAAQSADGELTIARQFGAMRVLAAGRALSNAFDAGDARVAAAVGATFRLGRYVALAGDVASLVDREDSEEVAWSAGLQLAIPYTPHTLSLHASNALTTTLQGTSRGTDLVRFGFEFTIPITVRRYLGRRGPAPAPPAVARDSAAPRAPPAAPDSVVQVTMQRLAYSQARIEVAAGTTVEWRNDDQVPHTVTADDGGWDSGLINLGATWRRTFDRPGTYAYHCTPHPFMKGVVVVR